MQNYLCAGLLMLAATASPCRADEPKKEDYRLQTWKDVKPPEGQWEVTLPTTDGCKATLRTRVAYGPIFKEEPEQYVELSGYSYKKKKDDKVLEEGRSGFSFVFHPLKKGDQLYLLVAPADDPKSKEIDKDQVVAFSLDGDKWSIDAAQARERLFPPTIKNDLNIDWPKKLVWTRVKK